MNTPYADLEAVKRRICDILDGLPRPPSCPACEIVHTTHNPTGRDRVAPTQENWYTHKILELRRRNTELEHRILGMERALQRREADFDSELRRRSQPHQSNLAVAGLNRPLTHQEFLTRTGDVEPLRVSDPDMFPSNSQRFGMGIERPATPLPTYSASQENQRRTNVLSPESQRMSAALSPPAGWRDNVDDLFRCLSEVHNRTLLNIEQVLHPQSVTRPDSSQQQEESDPNTPIRYYRLRTISPDRNPVSPEDNSGETNLEQEETD